MLNKIFLESIDISNENSIVITLNQEKRQKRYQKNIKISFYRSKLFRKYSNIIQNVSKMYLRFILFLTIFDYIIEKLEDRL